MANEQHIEILKQGVDIWNPWRDINSEILPDLSDRSNLWLAQPKEKEDGEQ